MRLALAILTAAVLMLAGCGSLTSGDRFVGNRHEQGRKPAYVAHMEAPHDGVFRVTYRRFYPTYGEFRFEGSKVTYSPDSPSQTDVSTYDCSTDS